LVFKVTILPEVGFLEFSTIFRAATVITEVAWALSLMVSCGGQILLLLFICICIVMGIPAKPQSNSCTREYGLDDLMETLCANLSSMVGAGAASQGEASRKLKVRSRGHESEDI
jgi:hypothetical protein